MDFNTSIVNTSSFPWSCFNISCEECLKNMLCHFCESDYQCHYKEGKCFRGMDTCHHIEDCFRKSPEKIGYGPPLKVVFIVLCMTATLATFLWACSLITSMCKPKKKMEQKNTMEETEIKQLLLDDNKNVSKEDLYSTGGSNRISSVHSAIRFLGKRLFFIVFIGLFMYLGLMFYPRMPVYNVCNRYFEWKSIFASLSRIHPNVDYLILLSVSNENRFGFTLEEGQADIYHNGTHVGNWTLHKPWTAHAGAISDIMVEMSLTPSIIEGARMLQDFEYKTLYFDINVSFSGSIRWGIHNIYRYSGSLDSMRFLVDDVYDRSLCKCDEYYKPTSKPTTVPVILSSRN